jgi:hypothetical protein
MWTRPVSGQPIPSAPDGPLFELSTNQNDAVMDLARIPDRSSELLGNRPNSRRTSEAKTRSLEMPMRASCPSLSWPPPPLRRLCRSPNSVAPQAPSGGFSHFWELISCPDRVTSRPNTPRASGVRCSRQRSRSRGAPPPRHRHDGAISRRSFAASPAVRQVNEWRRRRRRCD